MPKKRSASNSDSDSDSDSGPDDRVPEKKAKAEQSMATNDEGDKYFPLDKKKRVTVREFKGTVYVDIREFYDDKNGDQKPGKKGIALSVSNWNKLKGLVSDIDEAVSQF